jgi:hypothetical protein
MMSLEQSVEWLAGETELLGENFAQFFNWNPGQTRTLLQLKLVGILTINLFLT